MIPCFWKIQTLLYYLHDSAVVSEPFSVCFVIWHIFFYHSPKVPAVIFMYDVSEFVNHDIVDHLGHMTSRHEKLRLFLALHEPHLVFALDIFTAEYFTFIICA